MKEETEATERMTKILKKMHSPRDFAEPNEFIEKVKVRHR